MTVIVLGLFCGKPMLQGQIVVLGDSTNHHQLILNECGTPDTITIYLRVATGALTGTVELSDTLPAGFIVTGYIPSARIASLSGLNTRIATLTMNAPLNNGNTPTLIKLLVRASCGVNGLTSAVHTMRLTSTVGGGFNVVKSGQDFVSAIKAPTIILEARADNNRPNATIGSVHTRSWRIRNTGTNSTLDTVWFRAVYQPGTFYTDLEVNGVYVSPTRINGDTIWYQHIQNLKNQSVFPADTVFINESFRVNSCTDPSQSSEITAYWGCLNTPICNLSNLYPSVQIPSIIPNLRAQLVSVNNGCYGSYDTVVVRFINIGSGRASNVAMRIDQCYPIEAYTGPNGSSMSYIDTANIFVKTNTGTYSKTTPDSMVQYGFSRTFWPTSNPTATFYIRRSAINSGDTVYIRFRRFRGLYDNTMCTVTENYVNYMAWFTNICGTAAYSLPKTNLAGEAHRYYGKTLYRAPAYMINGDSGTIELTTNRGSGFNHYRVTGDFFMMKLELPAGLKWDGDSSKLKMTSLSSTFIKYVDSVSWNPTTRILEAYYRNFPSPNGWTTTPRMILDCSLGGVSGVNTIYVQYFNVRPVRRCGFQVLPYSCRNGNPITLICPGSCPRGGVVPYFAQIRRTTFGQVDNDNNGIPDGSGTMNMNLVEWDKMAPRDSFELTYHARIVRGSQSPAATFAYGYASIYIPQYGNMAEPVSGEIRVIDQSTGTSFTVTGLPFTKFDTSSRRRVEFDFSSTVSGFPGGFYFDDGDSIQLKLKFVYNRNVQESANPDDLVTTSNMVYVSPYSNPTSDTARYRCLDLPSNYRVVNVYKGYNGGFISRPTGCDQTTVYSDYFQSVGDCCANYAGSLHFPYEYRLFTTLDTVRILIPSGYVLDSTRITYVFTTGAGKAGSKVFSITPLSVIGDWYTFLLTPLYTFAGGSQVPSTTGSYWQMYNYIKSSCAVPANSILTQFTADRWIGRASWTGITTRGVPNNHTRGTYQYQNSAQLDVANVGATVVQGINRTISWDFQLQNNAIGAVANNVWIGTRSPTGRILVDSIRDLGTGTLLTSVNGIYQSGNLNGGGTIKQFRVFASYTACDFDSLIIYSGWNCTGYPASLAGTSGSCRADSIRTFVIPLNALVQTDLISAPADPSPLCDTLAWTVSVSSRQVAAAYDVHLDFLVPDGGNGAYLVPHYQYKYPANAPTWTNITPVQVIPGRYRFYISDSIAQIKTDGLRPIGEAPFNEILLRMRMVTNCNYTSGSSVRFIANSKKACGAVLPQDAEFDPIIITGAPGPKLLVLGTITPGITTCDSQFLMEIKLNNYETGTSSANDQLWAYLPAGSFYVPGSINFIRNPFSVTTPLVDTVGGRQRLRWVANGLPAFDSTVIQLNYYSPSNISCGGNSNLTLQAVSSYTATCATVPGGVCNSFVENNKLEQDRPVQKPRITYIPGSGSARLVQDTTAGNIYQPDSIILSNLIFRNLGNATANQPIIQLFADVNNNNIKDPGEASLFTDTFAPLAASGSNTYSKILLYGHKTLPPSQYLKLIVTQPCNCGSTDAVASLPSFYVPLDLQWGYFYAVKTGDGVRLDWMTLSETNTSKFVVQRKLASQNKFVDMGQVAAAGNSLSPRYYNYTDNQTEVLKDVVYYRLKLINLDGTNQRSEIRAVRFNGTSANHAFAFWPNPANTLIHISVAAEEGFSYRISNATGQVLLRGSCTQSFCTADVSNLSSGVYVLTVTDNYSGKSEKLLINR
ncbi:MAG: T9SS type A sorting domain-containing protein [Bacteroidetes bacterium]|nr:T9SS type A sorting domain-containing protein [Bacteroidota bacterium]